MKQTVWLGLILLGFALNAVALTVGDRAPDFTASATDGPVSLAALKGKWVVLYFYPKAFTPGCTKESCAVRDGYAAIRKMNAVVYGISLDRLVTQRKFKEEYKLPFELISDESKQMATAYGVLGMGGLYARRVTFLLNPEGKIAAILENVDVARHDQEITAALTALKKP